MTLYLSMQPLSEPADVGPDERGRCIVTFSALATMRASASFLPELALVLETAGVGVIGESIFYSSQVAIPEGVGPFVVLKTLPGMAPIGTHDEGCMAYPRPAAQVMTIASTFSAANATAHAAAAALAAIRNMNIEAE